MMTTVYLGLGSNLGNRERNITRAIEFLGEVGKVERVSSLYETAPMLLEDQPPFLNAACCLVTDLTPLELLEFTQRIEKAMGRVPGPRYGPRTLDIDILLYGDEIIDTPHLVVPHPEMSDRGFVLVPLAEIAPDLVHPTLGKAVSQLATVVKGKDGVVPWRSPWP